MLSLCFNDDVCSSKGICLSFSLHIIYLGNYHMVSLSIPWTVQEDSLSRTDPQVVYEVLIFFPSVPCISLTAYLFLGLCASLVLSLVLPRGPGWLSVLPFSR